MSGRQGSHTHGQILTSTNQKKMTNVSVRNSPAENQKMMLG